MSPKYESSSWDSRPSQETIETAETPPTFYMATPTFSLMHTRMVLLASLWNVTYSFIHSLINKN